MTTDTENKINAYIIDRDLISMFQLQYFLQLHPNIDKAFACPRQRLALDHFEGKKHNPRKVAIVFLSIYRNKSHWRFIDRLFEVSGRGWELKIFILLEEFALLPPNRKYRASHPVRFVNKPLNLHKIDILMEQII